MGPGGIVRIEIAFDVKQEMRRHQHGLNRDREALLHRKPVGLRHGDELLQRRHFEPRHRPPVGAPRERGQNPVDTRRSGLRIADQDAFAAGLLFRQREGPDDRHRADPLVGRVLVDVLLGERLHEIVVDEAEANVMVAFRQRHPDRFLGVRIEIHQARRLGLDDLRLDQLSVHPDTEGHGLGGGEPLARPLARQANAEVVVGVEVDAVCRLHIARIDSAEILEPEAVLDLNRLRQRFGGHGPLGNARGGRQVLVHQDRRYRQHIADIVEALARVVGREILVGAKLDGQQVANGVGVFRPIQPPRRHAARIRFDRGIEPREVGFEQLDQRRDLRLGPLDLGRWHLARLEPSHDQFPLITIGRERFHRPVLREVEAALGVGGGVALTAREIEEHVGGGLERGGRRRMIHGRRRGLRRRRERPRGTTPEPEPWPAPAPEPCRLPSWLAPFPALTT